MDANDELMLMLMLLYTKKYKLLQSIESINKRRKRRWWVRPVNKIRSQHGFYNTIIKTMKKEDDEEFFKFTRMNLVTFKKLLNMVHPYLALHGINRKDTINSEERLLLTLYYLAHGGSQQTVAWSFMVGKSTACIIIRKTCEVLWRVLTPIYLKAPTEADWINISDEFLRKWNFPLCVGALDGKHFNIQAPKKSGSEFFNYKKFFSIVLMGMCDANYKFTLVDIGAHGSLSDGAVLRNSEFGKALLANDKLNFPGNSNLPNTNCEAPYVIVADEAFPLQQHILRPFPGSGLTEKKRIFNYRLSRARSTIENAFGILTSRWRIFRHSIIADVGTINKIVGAAICLHNFIMEEEKKLPTQCRTYCPDSYIMDLENNPDMSDSIFKDITKTSGNNPANSVKLIRKNFANYFFTSGAIPHQRAHVNRGLF